MSAKLHITLVCLLLASAPAWGQYKIGIKVSPGVTYNRISTLDSTQSWGTHTGAASVVVGPVIDVSFANNYYFSTGVWFATRQLAARPSTMAESGIRNLQVIQLPLSIKLYTDEVTLDTRLYVQMGGIAEIKIDEQMPVPQSYVPVANLFNGSMLFGTGLEYRWGVNTLLFAGFSYQLGLFNVISYNTTAATGYDLKNDLVSLDIGIKF